MKFTDRNKEQERLKNVLERKEHSAFVVLYGRRRLGKSTLIKKILTEDDVYYMSEMLEEKLQIQMFAQTIATKISGFDQVIYPTWEIVFKELDNKTQSRFTLCLDEFPYLVKSSPSLPSVLQKLVDSKMLKFNIVICGSSQQMMYDIALDGSAPLFGRADALMRLSPIPVRYMSETLGLDAIATVEEYSVWGGVPRYWELREHVSGLFEGIELFALSSYGDLYDEPRHLLMDDMRDIIQASTILSVIGNGVNRLSEIAARLNKPASQLSGPLDKLRSLNLIKKEIPFGENEKNSKKSLYKISDSFMDFYYHYVVPYRSMIEFGRTSMVLNIVKNQFNHYVASHWEDLCRTMVSGQEIDGVCYGMASRWWGTVGKNESIELDVVAESLDGKHLLVGECKWTEPEDAEKLYEELSTKVAKFSYAKDKKVILSLFLKHQPKRPCSDVRIFYPEEVVKRC